MRIVPLTFWSHRAPDEALGAESKQRPQDPTAAAQAALDALHALPAGYAPRAARRTEKAFGRAVALDPANSAAQTGLLQILRERSAAQSSDWPKLWGGRAQRHMAALTQLGVVLRQRPTSPQLVAILEHADDLWAAGFGPQTESVLHSCVLGPLKNLLTLDPPQRALSRATLKAFGRLCVTQPWSLPIVFDHVEGWARAGHAAADDIGLLTPIFKATVQAPLQLAPRAVALIQQFVGAYPTESVVLSTCCQMLGHVLLPERAPMPCGQDVVALVARCAGLLPGEAPSYEGLRLLLQVAETYDGMQHADAAPLAASALVAAARVLEAASHTPSHVMLRSMAERSCVRLEQTGHTETARAATALLAQASQKRRVTAPQIL